jgi:hypothetical protein
VVSGSGEEAVEGGGELRRRAGRQRRLLCREHGVESPVGGVPRAIMADPDKSELPQSIDYADPGVPGGTVFRRLVYPSDTAGFLDPIRMVDDGVVLRLEPDRVYRRLIFLSVVWAAFVVGSSYSSYRHRFGFPAIAILIVSIMAVYSVRRVRRRIKTPWMVVDRKRRAIILPRSKNKQIEFANVIRLQVVNFGAEGFNGLSYHAGQPPDELQIVFKSGSKEEVWCVIHRPDEKVIRKFLSALHQASGIPVSCAQYLVSKEWRVEPFGEEHT